MPRTSAAGRDFASGFCESDLPMRFVGPHAGQRLRFLHTHVNPLPEFPALTHVQDVWSQPDHLVPPHIHATYEITYVVSGRGHWQVEGQSLDVRSGDCWVVHPGELHYGGADPDDPYHIFVLGIDPIALLRADTQTQNAWMKERRRVDSRRAEGALVLNAPAGDWQPAGSIAPAYDFGALEARSIRAPAEMGVLFERILRELDATTDLPRQSTERRLGVLMIQALLVEIFVHLARGDAESHATGMDTSGRFKLLHRWLKTTLHAPPTVPEMAEFCGLSPAHFSSEFKRDSGQSPAEYVLILRLHQAAGRLRAEPGTPVTRIALDLGFGSPQYFSAAFKAQFGTTPTLYRTT